MPELRKDPVTGRWVIIASARARRPSAFVMPKTTMVEPEECPFCHGHEHHTPSELLAYRPGHSHRDQPDWWLRVVPNKFPALNDNEPLERSGDGMYDRISGVGHHEVVIETPRHDATIPTMSLAEIEEVIWAYRDRSVELRKDKHIEYVMIFKNHLHEAGASLRHPHSQIIALPIVPKRVQEELDGALRYYDYKDRCVYCDMLTQELKDRERLVCEGEHFVSFVPYAAIQPFECWVLPRAHSAFFHDLTKNQVSDLAEVMHETVSRISDVLDDPPFNWMIHTTPLREKNETFYHWHIEIIPKTTRQAGFEWGTGFYINPLAPEEAAKFLQPGTTVEEIFSTGA